MNQDLTPLISYYAQKHKIPLRFLMALIKTESNFNPNACRYEKGYIWLYSVKEIAGIMGASRDTVEMIQKTSWGLGQLMGAIFHENKLYEWPAVMCELDTNLKYTCEHINKEIRNHNLSFSEPFNVYSCYNAGSVRIIDGRYVNSPAVRNFEKNYSLFSDLS